MFLVEFIIPQLGPINLFHCLTANNFLSCLLVRVQIMPQAKSIYGANVFRVPTCHAPSHSYAREQLWQNPRSKPFIPSHPVQLTTNWITAHTFIISTYFRLLSSLTSLAAEQTNIHTTVICRDTCTVNLLCCLPSWHGLQLWHTRHLHPLPTILIHVHWRNTHLPQEQIQVFECPALHSSPWLSRKMHFSFVRLLRSIQLCTFTHHDVHSFKHSLHSP